MSFQVNQTTAATSRIAHVAMDADGDFVVTWESNADGTNYDIYARRYVSTTTAEYQTNVTNPNLPLLMPFATNPLYGLNGENGGEFLVNSTTAGDQRYPGVGMDDTGDIIVVWSGQGQREPGRVLSTFRQVDRHRSSHRHRRGLHRRQHRQHQPASGRHHHQ